jgi:hypothetical protein
MVSSMAVIVLSSAVGTSSHESMRRRVRQPGMDGWKDGRLEGWKVNIWPLPVSAQLPAGTRGEPQRLRAFIIWKVSVNSGTGGHFEAIPAGALAHRRGCDGHSGRAHFLLAKSRINVGKWALSLMTPTQIL